MRSDQRHIQTRAFALPTVLIASVVLLAILAVSVTATTAVRTSLKNQYYAQLAQVAGEAGVAYAKACLSQNGNKPQWTNAKPLTPATDCYGNVSLSPSVRALVVAGGGSGGGSTGGGGGGGGVVYNEDIPITATSYPVTVGAGGPIPGNKLRGVSGSNSIFNGMTAVGGGGGGYSASATVAAPGYTGGSGGGGQNYSTAPHASGAGTAGQGYAGGPLGTGAASGGGGAGGAGMASSIANTGGDGGPGAPYNITGAIVYYGAGGGGGNGGNAGLGGNGKGSVPGSTGVGINAIANTGAGGGGGWDYATGNGGAGGSGVVIIAYSTASGINASGGTKTTVGAYTIHRFTSSGTFTVNALGSASCPSDPRCSVTVDDNFRSSFSVPRPTLDAEGRALTIENAGYVEILRVSTGAVWRTITQPGVQAAVVPDLCSGDATSGRGWAAAVKASTQESISSSTSAQTIALAAGNINAGKMYFRKDFTVPEAGNYELNILAGGGTLNRADAYIDKRFIANSVDALGTGSINLDAGCHSITVELVNVTVPQQQAYITASLTKQGSAIPVTSTDTTWRVSAGTAAHYSETDFYADPSVWTPVRVYGNPGWAGNRGALNINTTHSYDGSNNYPAASYSYYRDQRTITVTTPTEIKTAFACDDLCFLYLDGEQIMTGNASVVASATRVLQPGTHQFAMRLYNISGASYFYFSAFRSSDNAVLSQSDGFWMASNTWTSNQDFYSFEKNFDTFPAAIPVPKVDVIAVGGGGGGGSNHAGGGGGGGVVSLDDFKLRGRTFAVKVGAGGAGGVSNGSGGAGGASSVSDQVYVLGGGGGGGRIANSSTSTSYMGGSGGGGPGTIDGTTGVPGAGAWGVPGQGNKGGNGSSDATAGQGGGGGGAASAGGNGSGANVTGVSGTGGAGRSFSFAGTTLCFGGGGSGGRWGNLAGGIGAAGCRAGTGGMASAAGTAAVANSGSGGGGGGDATSPGGAGASGMVAIIYETGTMTATGGSIVSYDGKTAHVFYSSGDFTVTSVNETPPPIVENDAEIIYEGLSGYYNAGTARAVITIGEPLGDYDVPLPFVDTDYDMWACYGDPNCSPYKLLSGESTAGTLSWNGLGPTGTQSYVPPVTGQIVRYQLVSYGPLGDMSVPMASNIVQVTVP